MPSHGWLFYSFHCLFYPSFVKFICKYIILFDAIINGFIFLNLFLGCSLLYRNTSNFCLLISYPVIFLNSFITSNSIFCWSLRIFYLQGHVICKSRSFCFFLSKLHALILFSHVIALARTSSTMLTRSSESKHLCLVFELWGKAFKSFILMYEISHVFFIESFFRMRKFPSTPGWVFLLGRSASFLCIG